MGAGECEPVWSIPPLHEVFLEGGAQRFAASCRLKRFSIRPHPFHRLNSILGGQRPLRTGGLGITPGTTSMDRLNQIASRNTTGELIA
jgi:hypothetical protein